ncbi:hypothetical protein FRB99_006373 [Tulasnella sp. 403]|nr:hypothetical protein FRB99_006373 [Tulasnella sp. 403]
MNSAQYTYVDQINSNLVCCICRTPFIDPAVTTTCSHTFCRECIASALEVNPQCPVDRSLLTIQQLQPAATIVRNLVDELLVECPHAAVGCGLTCQRQLLLNHLASDCQYVQVQCSQEGCSHAVLRKDLGQHAEDCIHRLVECQACGRDVKLAEMNHLASCPYEAIKGFFAVHVVREKALEVENAELRRRVDELERVSRSHQRDLERAKLRLGPWFKAPSVERDGETASVDSTGSGEPLAPGTSPNPRPVEALRRRLSVPFNSAVFGVEDPLPAPRRSTISATDVPPAPEGSSSRNASFDDPYAGFANPTVHPILSNASGPSPFYLRAHSNYAVAPLNLGGSLESTLNSLRSSIVSLSGSLDSLERKQDIMLTTETLRMHEDVASLRAIVHGLRMQVWPQRIHDTSGFPDVICLAHANSIITLSNISSYASTAISIYSIYS